MSGATATIDGISALRFARDFESRLSARIMDQLVKMIEEQGEITVDDLRECIDRTLENARKTNDREWLKPDQEVLNASLEDIRHGRLHDIQDVIDEFQSAALGRGSSEDSDL
jgi:hypothetical protein